MIGFKKISSFLSTFIILFFFMWAPIAFSSDPLEVSKFGLEIEGKLSGYFFSVTGIGSEHEIIVHRIVDESGNEIEKKVPGRLKWSNITLSQGFSTNLDIYEWRQMVVEGRIAEARTNFSIIAFNENNEEVARWNFENGWPSKISTSQDIVPDLTSFYLIENVTIAHEGYIRLQSE